MDLFVNTSGPPSADIVIVGEAWGVSEAQQGRPFVGYSGQELTRILNEAGIDRDSCLLTNILHMQPPGNEMHTMFHPTQQARKEGRLCVRGLYPTDVVLRNLERLHTQIRAHPRKLIIALGNYPLWALTENNFSVGDAHKRKVPSGITQWRGSQLWALQEAGGFPLLPTYHPAAILRTWAWRYPMLHDLKSRVPLAMQGNWDEPQRNFIIRPNAIHVLEYFDCLAHDLSRGPTEIAVDLETRGGFIACCGIARSRTEAICIPFMQAKTPANYWEPDGEVEIIKALRHILTHPNIRIFGQNFVYDMQYIEREWHIIPNITLDTMVTHHLCWPGTPRALHYLSSLYCDYHRYWKEDGKLWEPHMPEEQLWNYNCLDAVVTFEVAHALRQLVKHMGLEEQLEHQTEMIRMAFDMMLTGIRVDREVRGRAALELMDAIAHREKRLNYLLPESVWPRKPKAKPWYRSPKQLGQIFYDHLGVKEIRNRKTRARTVDDEALNTISAKEPLLAPICEALQELRSLTIFARDAQAACDRDGRMRCSFDPAGTETFRWSSSKNAWGRGMNLQTVSEGREEE